VRPAPARATAPAALPFGAELALPIEWLPEAGVPEQLLLLLHGWRGDALRMHELALALRSGFPRAAILAPDGPDPGDGTTQARSRGRQWYAVSDLTQDEPGFERWRARVLGCVPGLAFWVRAQQQRLGVAPAATALAGFSQGGIIALATAMQHDGLVGRVLAFAGRLMSRPECAPQRTTVHLFHGSADEVIPAGGSRDALRWLGELQGDATLDIGEGIGHELHTALIERALDRLRSHIPLRTWREALGAAPGCTGQREVR
jgi:phospholipase/carboxylesterase